MALDFELQRINAWRWRIQNIPEEFHYYSYISIFELRLMLISSFKKLNINLWLNFKLKTAFCRHWRLKLLACRQRNILLGPGNSIMAISVTLTLVTLFPSRLRLCFSVSCSNDLLIPPFVSIGGKWRRDEHQICGIARERERTEIVAITMNTISLSRL